MRRLTVVFIVVAVVMVSGPQAVAQMSSPIPAPAESPFDVGGRFVLPEAGYALYFPEGWDVQVHPLDYPAREPGHAPVAVVRAEAPHERPGSSTDVAFCEVKVFGPCDGSCSTAIDGWAAREVAWFESGTDVPVPSSVESVLLTLPAGDAVRVRTEYTDLESDRSMYYLTDGRVVATLLCVANHGPEDHWLSVAETFEFLPAEGPIASQAP